MDPLFVQNLRYKLQKRVSRLNSVEGNSMGALLSQFWMFFDQQPTFVGITEELLARVPDTSSSVERIFEGTVLYGKTEEHAAAIGYLVLRRLAVPDPRKDISTIGLHYIRKGGLQEGVEAVREIFLEPFYEYVDERLDDQRAMLALLLRYKHRSEWFHRGRLWDLSQMERRGEKGLAMDLYSYLYDQGIDFHIESSSITGEIDLIAAQNTDDPLLLDAKIFNGAANYIRKAFRQIYTYTQQHNEPFGYLVIYNTSHHDLRFSLRIPGNIPSIVHNHKTIFIITIDIYPHEKSVSQRPPLTTAEITEESLIGILLESSEA